MKNRKNAGRDRRVRKKKSLSLGRHKKSVLMISAVLVMLCGVLAVNSITLMAKNDSYKKQEQELKSQIEEQKERAEVRGICQVRRVCQGYCGREAQSGRSE